MTDRFVTGTPGPRSCCAFRNLAMLLLTLLVPAVLAHSQCSNPANAIVAENCLRGNPSTEWDTGPGSVGDLSIQGYATDISVNQGSTVYFKIDTPATAYTITIYRVGYYGGMGARKITTIAPSAQLPQAQPACLTDSITGLADCGNWGVSASWNVPATATSGIYFAHLIRSDTGGDSHIVFVVRNDSSHSDVLYQTADESWQAYNYYGSGSLYSNSNPTFDLNVRSFKVSYNRPFLTRGFNQEWDTWLFGAEFAMIQWVEQNGYDVTYFTGVDSSRNGALIKNHRIFMDSGHDEYWAGPQRTNVQAARDSGVNLAFFSGNTMFWKTRWENSIDGTNTPYRTLVCYKETLASAKIDPQDPPTWTGTWRDPSFSPPADGGNPENRLLGTMFMVNGTGADNDGSQTIKVPAEDGQMRFWRNTAAAKLAANQTYTLPVASLGYEWDLDLDNGARPSGLFHLSTATYSLTSDYLLDQGGTYGAGVATHHLTLYRAPSGALVFSSASIDWSWGLNSNHDNLWYFSTPAPDPNVQQATVNLFADMGVQPTTLQSGIAPASQSTDTTPPTSTITYPTNGANIHTGTAITVTGNASDSGGVVAGVEFSFDGGSTWHPANGRSTWSYTWTPSVVNSSLQLLSRAVDDSGNLETLLSGVTINVLPQTCPCSVWNSSITPVNVDSGDPSSVELGFKLRADANGSIIGVRFYKAASNTGVHVGHVWSDSGTLLGSVSFTSESSSGWQTANFSSPIPVVANTTYVVSYFAPAGHYAADANYFAQSGADNPPVHALANGVDGGDGVFYYPPSSTAGGFPSSSNGAANYWVDVVYTSSNTYNISGAISGLGGASASVALSGTENISTTSDASGNFSFSGVVNGSYTVTPSKSGVAFRPSSQTVTVNGAVVTGVNFTATVINPLTISGTVAGASGASVQLSGAASATSTLDSSGNYSFSGLLNGSYSVTPVDTGFLFSPVTQSVNLNGSSAAGINFQGTLCNCISLWPPTATPAQVDSGDRGSVEVGVKIRASDAGIITGLRFYKAPTNTGTHVGHLWSNNGVLLGSLTFSGETASGWQQANFSTPIATSANTTYIASYYAPAGHYSDTSSYFASSGITSGVLQALQNGVDGGDGVYTYTTSSTGGYPNNSYSSDNYWVDVLYSGAPSYTLSGTILGGAGASVALSGAGTLTTMADSSGNYSFTSVASGNYSVTPSLLGVVFLPGNQNVAVSGANLTGVNFTTPQMCKCYTLWTATTQPSTVDAGDPLPYELGVKFRTDTDGYILGVRFYKSAANTGTHTAHLWSGAVSQSPLSSATFVNESGSGWQQVMFTNPVPVSAYSTYIASYFDPAGHYAANSSFFATTGVDNPPIHALATGVDGPNGVYVQSSTSMLPTQSYDAANYWIDIIYASATTHSLGGMITGPGAAGATVTLSGSSSATTTADAFGNYSFNGLANGTYTAAPSKSGYIFTPASQSATISGAHVLSVNFNSAVPTYTVSGSITGGSGVTISLSGPSTATVTADSSGNYSFPPVANGTYTVTASRTGFTISPTSQNVTVSGANVGTVNFTATAIPYSISGTITGGAAATIYLTGDAAANATADASGNYSFPAVTSGLYTILPAKSGLVFSPTSFSVAIAGTNISGVNFVVPASCPCATVWQPLATPSIVDADDNGSVELGVKFRSDTAGYITGVRFYKGPKNTGVHQGRLWSSTGTLLASATFTSESASGWQQVFFSTPIAVAANTTYVASYFAPSGQYSANSGFFLNTGVDSGPLHELATGVDGANGLYGYSATGGFPANSYNATNYWVDVIYIP